MRRWLNAPIEAEMTDTIDQRVDALEMHIAHQDQSIDDMNAVILAQGEEIERLTRRLNKLMGRVGELEESMPAPEAKKPPHW